MGCLENPAFGQAKDLGCQIMEEDTKLGYRLRQMKGQHIHTVLLIDNSSAEALSQKIGSLLNLT